MKKILIASENRHKIDEFKQILIPLGYEVTSLLDLTDKIVIEETGLTFEENAIIKAEALSKALNCECIADDSGLEIDCLNKEPGIYSARYMGYDTSYLIKNQNLIERTACFQNRSCRFVCVIAYACPNHETKIFRGEVEGEVAHQIDGENGFGYDPIFYYPPLKMTFSSIDSSVKNKISHRHSAIMKLVAYFNA